MNHYPRKPALIVVVVALTLGVIYVSAWGRIERLWKKQPADQSIEALKQRIDEGLKKGNVPIATWQAYGEALADAKQYTAAAAAFQEVLAQDPAKREAKFGCGLALAQANKPDEFYAFLKDMVFGEPKLAVELFERPEAQKFMGEARFAALSKEAKNQAMD